jgi:hypothetical protein
MLHLRWQIEFYRVDNGGFVMAQYELNTVKAALKSAFAPLQCVVKDLNYGNSILLDVLDDKGKLLLEEEYMANDICSSDSDTGFPAIVGMTRERLAERGYALAPKKTYI